MGPQPGARVAAPTTAALAAAAAGGLAFALLGPTAEAAADAQTAAPAATAPDPYRRPKELVGLPATPFTLYQYEVCPFCCKVKAMLDYHKLPYRIVEVNPLTKGELGWSTYKKVPVLTWGDATKTAATKTDQSQRTHVEVDSSAIMSRLAAELGAAKPSPTPLPPSPSDAAAPAKQQPSSSWLWASLFGGSSGSPATAASTTNTAQATQTAAVLEAPKEVEDGEDDEETRWRKWVDARFVKLITANIYRSWDETVDSFKYITSQTNWSWGTRELARWFGATLMWQIGKRMPAKYAITGDLRDALYAEANAWVEAVGVGRPFMGGAAPNLADLAVYGVLRAVAGTPTFNDVMAHSRIKPWYERVQAAIGQPASVA